MMRIRIYITEYKGGRLLHKVRGYIKKSVESLTFISIYIQFTFGIDHQIVLAADDLFLAKGISLVSNPVKAGESNIQITTSEVMVDLKASIYDINGRLMKTFDTVDVSMGIGNLSKSNLKSGLYFILYIQHT